MKLDKVESSLERTAEQLKLKQRYVFVYSRSDL